MSDEHDLSSGGDEEAMARLLRLGARSAVPAERMARVRAAVLPEWQAVTGRRRARRRIGLAAAALATAAGLLLAVGWLTLPDRGPAISADPVAVVERLHGTPRRVLDTTDGRAASPLSRDDVVRAGESIETGPGAGLALRFADGTSVRLDAGSRVRPLSPRAIELLTGAAYVDTGRETGQFEVRTPLATARDVGTQFEVRLLDHAVRLRVRTGMVELSDRQGTVTGNGGTEITLSNGGAVSRPIAPHGADWDWAARLSPAPMFEGATLPDFLGGLAREHGWTVRWANPDLARNVAAIVLHGSVEGLSPGEAVEVAVSASGLGHRLENGELVVTRAEGEP